MVVVIQINRHNAKEVNTSEYIGVNSRQRNDDNYFVTTKYVVVSLSNGEGIEIPNGYEFDGSSVPKWLRWWKSTYGEFMLAALIHDWLYYSDYNRVILDNNGTPKYQDRKAKQFADKEMLFWSNIVNGFTKKRLRDNKQRYWAVKYFGTKVFKK